MALMSPTHDLETLRMKAPETVIQLRARLRIPKARHSDPVLSNLIHRYGLTVTISGALLGSKGQEDGWFDLHLQGQTAALVDALLDLVGLEVDIWLDLAAVEGPEGHPPGQPTRPA